MNYTDKFGIIPTPVILMFDQGRIEPVDDYEMVMSRVKEHSHHEGYLYPPTIYSERGKKEFYDISTGTYSEYEIVPNSERPSPVLHLPPTHTITLYKESIEGDRNGIGSFVIFLVGFLYGVRTQFLDWRIDGRGMIKGRNDFTPTATGAGKCISTAISVWSDWNEDERKRMTNILFLYTKAISEEYEWLEFTLLYLVFDACYRFAYTKYSVTAKYHEERLKNVAEHFGIKKEPDLFNQWATLRNNLFHEALWRGDHIGASTFSNNYHSILYFPSFISRVIVALLGYETEYITYSWRNLGKVAFD